MVTAFRPGHKPGRPPSAADQLARLRAAINGRRFWVLCTDHGPAVDACRALAALLTLFGAAPGQVLLVELEARPFDRAEAFDATALAVAKTLLPAAGLAELVAGLTGESRREVLARVAAGKDIVPLGYDPRRLAVLLDRVRSGRVATSDPATN